MGVNQKKDQNNLTPNEAGILMKMELEGCTPIEIVSFGYTEYQFRNAMNYLQQEWVDAVLGGTYYKLKENKKDHFLKLKRYYEW